MEAQGIVVFGETGDRDRHLGPAPSPANCRQTGHPTCPSSPGYKRSLPCGCGISDADESVVMDSRGLRAGSSRVQRWNSQPHHLSVGPQPSYSTPVGLSPFLSEAVRKKAAVGSRRGTHCCGNGGVETGSSHLIHDPMGATVAWEKGCGYGWWSEECKWESRCQAILCPQCVLEGTLGRTVPSSAPVPTTAPAAPSMAPANVSLDGSAKTAHRVSCCPPGNAPQESAQPRSGPEPICPWCFHLPRLKSPFADRSVHLSPRESLQLT